MFDLLQTPRGADLTARPLSERRTALEAFFATLGDTPALRLSPATEKRAEAERWLKRAGGGELDGVVAKRLDEPYRAGERAMVKVKCLRTADCVVGGLPLRHEEQAGRARCCSACSTTEGKLDHVGFTSGISDEGAPELTRKVEA